MKSHSCDHPDPLSEPRAAASIRLLGALGHEGADILESRGARRLRPELNEHDALALPVNVAEAECLAAIAFFLVAAGKS